MKEHRIYLVKQTQEEEGYVGTTFRVFTTLEEAEKCAMWHNKEYGSLDGESLPEDFDIWCGPEDGWGASDHFYTVESITVEEKWKE